MDFRFLFITIVESAPSDKGREGIEGPIFDLVVNKLVNREGAYICIDQSKLVEHSVAICIGIKFHDVVVSVHHDIWLVWAAGVCPHYFVLDNALSVAVLTKYEWGFMLYLLKLSIAADFWSL